MKTLTVICTEPSGYPSPLIYRVSVNLQHDEQEILNAVKAARALDIGVDPDEIDLALEFAFEGDAPLKYDFRD